MIAGLVVEFLGNVWTVAAGLFVVASAVGVADTWLTRPRGGGRS